MSVLAFRDRSTQKRVALDVTPLIDVLFLLIIFFSLTSTFKRVGELELELPESSTSETVPTDSPESSLEVVLTEEGLYFLDGSGLDRDELVGRLSAAVEEDDATRVLLKAEAGVPHGEVVDLLDVLRDTGFRGVGIGTYRGAPLASPAVEAP